MVRKFYSIAVAIALVVALLPAPQAHAINREIHYTVWYVGIFGPAPTEPVGEWTKYCDGSMGGWGVQPYQCSPGNPPDRCETDVVFGDICEE